VNQKRALLAQSFTSILHTAQLSTKVVLDTIEMLLLIIWRHLDYYFDKNRMSTPPTKATVGNAMRLLATTEPEVFRKEVANKMGGILARLGGIALVSGWIIASCSFADR
jgi:nuclear pore complex protein Nup205